MKEQTLVKTVRYHEAGAMIIAGLKESYTQETRMRIPEQWQRFGAHLGRIPGQIGRVTYGVCLSFEPPCSFDYLTGVQVARVDALPERFVHVELAPQRYAVFEHVGHASGIPNTVQASWAWLNASEHKASGAPSFERYGDGFDPVTLSGDTEIWIPILA